MSTPVLGPLPGPTRRHLTAAGAALALLGLTGCTGDDPDQPPALPRLRRNPDHDLVVSSLAMEQAHLDRLRAVRDRHRRLRAALSGPAAVHLAHVELLRGAVDDEGAPESRPWSVPGSPERALAALAGSARVVARGQTDIAMAAASGTFARLAAGMAAAAAQQEQHLAAVAPPRRRGAAG